jgi:hypothetical protein
LAHAFLGCGAVEELADAAPSGREGSLGGTSEQRLQLGEQLLDRIEVGAVGRQEEQLGASLVDGLAHRLAFVAAEVVDDHDVAGRKRRCQDLLNIGEEASAVDRPVDDAGRGDAVMAECREEGHGAPAAVRHLGDKPLTLAAAAMAARHVGLRPGLVDEHQAARIKPGLVQLP